MSPAPKPDLAILPISRMVCINRVKTTLTTMIISSGVSDSPLRDSTLRK
jgi:hypothetical protein